MNKYKTWLFKIKETLLKEFLYKLNKRKFFKI